MLNSLVALYDSGAGGGGATSFESIQTVTVGAGGTATIDFTSIPSTYSHLQLRGFVLMSDPSYGNLRFNSDTTASNYYFHQMYGTGSSALAASGNSGGYYPMNNSVSTSYGDAGVIDILDYANTDKYKTVRQLEGQDANGSGFVNFASTLWKNTAAINRITITASAGTFSQYSSFALYGIKA